LHDCILRKALGEVIRERLGVNRIARQSVGQCCLRLRIVAPWRERYCRGSVLASRPRVAKQRFTYRRVCLP
jgi:hypothetical protein